MANSRHRSQPLAKAQQTRAPGRRQSSHRFIRHLRSIRHLVHGSSRHIAMAVMLLLLTGLVLWLARQHHTPTAQDLKTMALEAGRWGPLLYIGILTLSIIISHIPGIPLAMTAGMIWGSFWAGIYSIIGGFMGAIITYAIGYYLGKPVLKCLTGKTFYFVPKRGAVYMGWLLFMTRLLPIVSFDVVSYGAGVTRIPLPLYCTATLLGMIPSTFLLTYFGVFFITNQVASIWITGGGAIAFIFFIWGIQRFNWFGLKDVIRYE